MVQYQLIVDFFQAKNVKNPFVCECDLRTTKFFCPIHHKTVKSYRSERVKINVTQTVNYE